MQLAITNTTPRCGVPRSGRRFDEHYVPLVAERLRRFMNLSQIADDLALNRKTAAKLARKAGFTDHDVRLIVTTQRLRQPSTRTDQVHHLYVDRGLTLREVAATLATPLSQVRRDIADAGLSRPRGVAKALGAANPLTKRGRARLDAIAEVVRMRHIEGASYDHIAERLGRSNRGVRFLYRTPYGRARAACVYGSATITERRELARQMSERMGLPSWFIAKVVEVDVVLVDEWLTTPRRRSARKVAA